MFSSSMYVYSLYSENLLDAAMLLTLVTAEAVNIANASKVWQIDKFRSVYHHAPSCSTARSFRRCDRKI